MSNQLTSTNKDLKDVSPAILADALEVAGLPVVSVASSGRIDFARELTKEEDALLPGIIDAAKHRAPGILDVATRDEILLAIWELAFNGSMTRINTLKDRLK